MVCATMIVQLIVLYSFIFIVAFKKYFNHKNIHIYKYHRHTDKMHYCKVGLLSKFMKVIEYIASTGDPYQLLPQ